MLDLLTNDVKTSATKALILLAKYHGRYSQFKARLNEYGIKLYRPNSLDAFLRILNAGNSDIMQYYRKILPILRKNERLFAKYLLHSGLRVSEAIASFNQIITLSKQNKLNEYYDENINCLCHFKYPKQFIRRTKNCYITFVTREFLDEISQSQNVTYSSIRKRLQRKKLTMRFDEFRDYFGTHLVNNGILEIEQNLLCGRIPIGIFVRHYWSPKLKELGNRVFQALKTIEKSENIDYKKQLELIREYPVQARLSPDGNYYATPTIEAKVDYIEPELNILSFSQETNSDGSIKQEYTLDGSGYGKACLIIAIWNYSQTADFPAFPSGEFDSFYYYVSNCWKYDYWHTLTNDEATHYNIWAWITWACAEFEMVDVFMEGHGTTMISGSLFSSVFASWDVQTNTTGLINYWNFFFPQEIMYGYWSYYDYSALRMGVFHFCYSWGGSWYLGFEMPFVDYDYPMKSHSSAFIGPSGEVYYSPDFVSEWSIRWLWWNQDSYEAYINSIWAQSHQDTNPLLYADHGGPATVS